MSKKKAPVTAKSVERQIKSIENEKKRLRDKIWETRDIKKRRSMDAEAGRLEIKRRKLSEKRDKLLIKEAIKRREKRRKK